MKKRVSLTLEEELLKRIDEYAKKNYLSRSGLVSVAVNQYLTTLQVLDSSQKMANAFENLAQSGKFTEEQVKELQDAEKLMNTLTGANK